MKKMKVLKFFVWFCIILLCSCFIINYLFFDIQSIKPGEKILCKSKSPKGTYTITAYLDSGNATTDFSVLCVLDNGKNTKKIYSKYHCEKAKIKWIDDNTVIINGIRLENVESDIYDWRREEFKE